VLRRLAEGESVVDPTSVLRLLGRRRTSALDELTAREREVLEGLSHRAIAERLVVAERTVETDVNRIFKNLICRRTPILAAGSSPCSPASADDGLPSMTFDPITRHHEAKAAQHSALRSALSGRPDEADSLMEERRPTTVARGKRRRRRPRPMTSCPGACCASAGPVPVRGPAESPIYFRTV